jgi:hypothetical protein
MPRPIESLLSLPRVRLFDRVPILETERLVRRYIDRPDYHPKLVKPALEVSRASAQQFSSDDEGLSALLEEIGSAEYIVTRRSRKVMEEMLNGICDDGSLFKEFEGQIQPLCQLSHDLLRVSRLADSLADKTKEESIDVARALMIGLPKRDGQP